MSVLLLLFFLLAVFGIFMAGFALKLSDAERTFRTGAPAATRAATDAATRDATDVAFKAVKLNQVATGRIEWSRKVLPSGGWVYRIVLDGSEWYGSGNRWWDSSEKDAPSNVVKKLIEAQKKIESSL